MVGSLYRSRWTRYGLTLLVLGFVVLKVQPDRVLRSVGSARPEYLVFALALTAPFLYLKALRWYMMLRAAGVSATFGEALLSLIGGMGLALVTPARLGELVRLAFLRDRQKMKIGALVMIDKGFDVLVLTGLSIVGAGKFLGIWAGLVFGLATLAGLLLVCYPRRPATALRSMSARTPMKARLDRAWDALASLSPVSSLVYLGITLLAFVIVLLQFGIILLSWWAWSPEIVFLTFPLVVLTNVLPLTVGGLGVREGAAAVLLGHYGVPASDAILAAFLMFAINTALPGVIGALALPLAGVGVEARLVDSSNRP